MQAATGVVVFLHGLHTHGDTAGVSALRNVALQSNGLSPATPGTPAAGPASPAGKAVGATSILPALLSMLEHADRRSTEDAAVLVWCASRLRRRLNDAGGGDRSKPLPTRVGGRGSDMAAP